MEADIERDDVDEAVTDKEAVLVADGESDTESDALSVGEPDKLRVGESDCEGLSSCEGLLESDSECVRVRVGVPPEADNVLDCEGEIDADGDNDAVRDMDSDEVWERLTVVDVELVTEKESLNAGELVKDGDEDTERDGELDIVGGDKDADRDDVLEGDRDAEPLHVVLQDGVRELLATDGELDPVGDIERLFVMDSKFEGDSDNDAV